LKQPAVQILDTMRLAFPNRENAPTRVFEFALNPIVARDVRIKLLAPEFDARLRRVCKPASRVPVPEASVHEHHCLMTWQDDVWSTGKITSVKPEAVAELMQRPSDGELRLRIPLADARHHGASLGINWDRFGQISTPFQIYFSGSLCARRVADYPQPTARIERAPAGAGARIGGQ
jgi:hypothetical protein